jgi:primosomal protein N' (replication factor Y)
VSGATGASDAGAGAIARVAVEVEPFHLDRPFDYLVGATELEVGSRVEVVFAGRRRRGLVVGLADTSEVPAARLRPVRRVLGDFRWAEPEDIELWRWAAERFGAPLADVVRHALPDRVVDVERRAAAAGWFPPGAGATAVAEPAPDLAGWEPYGERGARLTTAVASGRGSFLWRPLAGEDVGARLGELVAACLAGGRDALVVVPDRASPVAEAVLRLAADVAVDLRGPVGQRARYSAWLSARCGRARVVVGERGAAFVPLARLGLAVVLDEANPALKERRSPRHHAREVVLERARRAHGVGLAIGTVPSATMWSLVEAGRVERVEAPPAVARARRPRVVVATGELEPRARLTRASLSALRSAIERGAYGVVLVGRRGDGHALVCRACGTRALCPTCAAWIARTGDGWTCAVCGTGAHGAPRCPACASTELVPLLAGAARLASELSAGLDVPVAALEGYDAEAPPAPAVLVMTRGSVLDAPPGEVAAVVLADLDAALARPTLDAAEDTLRLAAALESWLRTDPAHVERAPVLVVETRDPQHHAVRAIVEGDADAFWRVETERRRPLRFPPVSAVIALEVPGAGLDLAEALDGALPTGDELLGPLVAAAGERWLVKTDDRAATLAALAAVRAGWSQRGVDVRLDVDPVGEG